MQEKDVTTVVKPWGREVWLELNDKYCYKRLYINAGYRTSKQYHNHKLETNYIISGEAKVQIGDDSNMQLMHAGDFFTILPGVVHRIEAITDLVLQEVSTPEVYDVVRLEDDTYRK
jgi:mannose-6-phosphate isomerase-like protein (cupin superfamily)